MSLLPGIATGGGGPGAPPRPRAAPLPSLPFFSRDAWQEAGGPALVYFGAAFAAGGVALAICDLIWPGFYLYPVPAGPDTWRAAQGLSLIAYVIAFCCAFFRICRWRRADAVTSMRGTSPAERTPAGDPHADARSSHRCFPRRFGWPVIAYCYAGATSAAFWVYSGMPMICH